MGNPGISFFSNENRNSPSLNKSAFPFTGTSDMTRGTSLEVFQVSAENPLGNFGTNMVRTGRLASIFLRTSSLPAYFNNLALNVSFSETILSFTKG
ncbi:hypothetical protein D3C87_1725680 [compost metagenome]